MRKIEDLINLSDIILDKLENIHMSNLKEKLTKGGVTAVIVITILAVCYGLSWIVTCGIIKLITMCFGLTFKWSIATGIWLIICILRSVFNVTVKNK